MQRRKRRGTKLGNRNGAEKLFKKGHKKTGGRTKGTPNKMTVLVKHGIEESLRAQGDYLQQQYLEEEDQRYERYAMGGVVAGLLWLMNREPASYIGLVGRLLPMQLQGKLEGEVQHKYTTIAEIERAMRERGLPVPPRMIDVTPIKREAA